MFRKGFTLAEVLITLMIIGVVATLTTPALVKNVGSSKIGPKLSKFVNTWDSAVESLLLDEGVSLLEDANNDLTFGSNIVEKLSKYMIMSSLKHKSGSFSINLPNGTAWYSQKYSYNTVWQLKDGTILLLKGTAIPMGATYYLDKIQFTGAYKRYWSTIFVDIGGMKGPHRLGKEVFCFMVDSTGMLIPYGSNAHKFLAPKFDSTCNNSSDDPLELLACTGAVADNGYKAPW